MVLTLTRADILRLLADNATFRAVLETLKGSEGYSPEKVSYLDDHDAGYPSERNRIHTCTDFIAVVRLLEDGTPIKDTSRWQAMWIFPGFSDRNWHGTQSQNPLYANSDDNKIHLTTCAQGSILRRVSVGSTFDRIVRAQKLVHFTDMTDYDGPEKYEAHIHLTIDDLAAL